MEPDPRITKQEVKKYLAQFDENFKLLFSGSQIIGSSKLKQVEPIKSLLDDIDDLIEKNNLQFVEHDVEEIVEEEVAVDEDNNDANGDNSDYYTEKLKLVSELESSRKNAGNLAGS